MSKARIFIHPGSMDLRKGISGLTAIVQGKMGQDPFNGSVYIFCNRRRKLIKAVYWDKAGFRLSQKRLERDTFPWPRDEREAMELSWEQLHLLLAGIDFFRAHQEVFYTKVA
jgi:transposase